MSWVSVLQTASELAKTYHTIEKSVSDLESNVRQLHENHQGMRTELTRIEGRLSTLDESRKTIAAEVKTVLVENLAGLEKFKSEISHELQLALLRNQHEFAQKVTFYDAQPQSHLESSQAKRPDNNGNES